MSFVIYSIFVGKKEVLCMEQDNSYYDAVIADLVAERDSLNSAIETLMRRRGLGGTLPPPTAASAATRENITEADLPHDAFFGLTIPDAAKKYLGITKKTRPHATLCEALLAGGLKTSSANFRETVRSVLGRQPDFVKVNSEWGLAEWYPAMRRDRKQRNGPPQVEPNKETNDGTTKDDVEAA